MYPSVPSYSASLSSSFPASSALQVSRAAGHLAGFESLAGVLESCLDMGITEVTVYAFSIENFNRSQEEVDCLFDLCREKFGILLEGRQQQLLMENQVCVRIIGELF